MTSEARASDLSGLIWRLVNRVEATPQITPYPLTPRSTPFFMVRTEHQGVRRAQIPG